MNIRPILEKDQIEIKRVYFDSIKSISEKIYTKEQKFNWAIQAWENPEFIKTIINGEGWIIEENNLTLGFAIRYPMQKLSLLYVRGDKQRNGFGTILLKKIENDAKKQGIRLLNTEASLISYKLLLKNNWMIVSKEKILINESFFDRYKMKKKI